MTQSPRWIALIFCCALIAAFGGCSSNEPSLMLSGKVTRNGQPLALQADEYVTLVFYELDDKGELGLQSFSAAVQPDGTYQGGIEEGKYRISLQIMKKGDFKDQLGGVYTQSASPLTKDVTGSEDDYIIDVAG